MSLYHAVAFVDLQSAQVLQFGSDHMVAHKVREHLKFARQHQSNVPIEHEFFGPICDALEGVSEVLAVGGHAGLADFRHYMHTYRPLTAERVVGYEVVEHPTENQLVALARQHFAKYDQFVDTRVPT